MTGDGMARTQRLRLWFAAGLIIAVTRRGFIVSAQGCHSALDGVSKIVRIGVEL